MIKGHIFCAHCFALSVFFRAHGKGVVPILDCRVMGRDLVFVAALRQALPLPFASLPPSQAHTAPGSPDRVVFYFSFAAAPSGPAQELPFGPTYAIRLGLWGQKTLRSAPWGTDTSPGGGVQAYAQLLHRKLRDHGALATNAQTVLLCVACLLIADPVLQSLGSRNDIPKPGAQPAPQGPTPNVMK